MQKKGQITTFIIIGIIVAFSLGVIYTITQGYIPGIGVPNEIRDIKKFTESCLDAVSKEGISIMAVQGGYIEIPKSIRSESSSYLNHGFIVPLWYYSGQNRMPTLKMMEDELSSHIAKNLPECLNNFSAFHGKYSFSTRGGANIKTKINENNIVVKMDYPLQIKILGEERVYNLNEYSAEIKSNLGKLYSLARIIMEKENRDAFLENYTDEMIACSDWLPYEGMEFSCQPKVWFEDEMKKYVQTLIMHNLHFLMFENTDIKPTGIPYYDKQYLVKAVSGSKYKGIKVNIIYNPEWPMEFEVTPSEDGVVRANEFKIANLIGTCVKVYHHKYSLNYPVLFQLIDREHPLDQFYFATPVIIKRNLPNRYGEVPLWPEEIDRIASKEFCALNSSTTTYLTDKDGQIVALKGVQNKRRYSLRVYAVDKEVGYPDGTIPDVRIKYQCVQFLCDIGNTNYLYEEGLIASSLASLDALFPTCSGGILIAEKSGYMKARQQVSVDEETDRSQVVIEMVPLKKLDFDVRVVEDHNGLIQERDIAPGETALINLKNPEMGYDLSLIYPSDFDYYNNFSIMVGDFTYQVDIKLVKDELYLGGASLNWTPSKSEIKGRRHAVFYALSKNVIYTEPTALASLLEFVEVNSNKYPPVLR
ncbi:MAG: hypothetical protein QXK37_02080 [Candidatus Woesearchaeota archaeon]